MLKQDKKKVVFQSLNLFLRKLSQTKLIKAQYYQKIRIVLETVFKKFLTSLEWVENINFLEKKKYISDKNDKHFYKCKYLEMLYYKDQYTEMIKENEGKKRKLIDNLKMSNVKRRKVYKFFSSCCSYNIFRIGDA